MKVYLATRRDGKGIFMDRILKEAGVEVATSTSENPDQIAQESADADFVILNLLLTNTRRLIGKLAGKVPLIETSDSKESLLDFAGRVISINFLDDVLQGSGNTRALYVSDISPEGSTATLEDLFKEIKFEHLTSSAHDKIISEVLVKPYIMALLSRKVTNLDFDPVTVPYDLALELSRLVTNENVDRIRDIIRNNTNTPQVFALFEENLKRVWNELSFY